MHTESLAMMGSAKSYYIPAPNHRPVITRARRDEPAAGTEVPAPISRQRQLRRLGQVHRVPQLDILQRPSPLLRQMCSETARNGTATCIPTQHKRMQGVDGQASPLYGKLLQLKLPCVQDSTWREEDSSRVAAPVGPGRACSRLTGAAWGSTPQPASSPLARSYSRTCRGHHMRFLGPSPHSEVAPLLTPGA